jgi:hypothetical protein
MLHQDEADDIAWFTCKNNFIEIKKNISRNLRDFLLKIFFDFFSKKFGHVRNSSYLCIVVKGKKDHINKIINLKIS